ARRAVRRCQARGRGGLLADRSAAADVRDHRPRRRPHRTSVADQSAAPRRTGGPSCIRGITCSLTPLRARRGLRRTSIEEVRRLLRRRWRTRRLRWLSFAHECAALERLTWLTWLIWLAIALEQLTLDRSHLGAAHVLAVHADCTVFVPPRF